MRLLLSFLMALAALSLSPVRAWAGDHGHCEEPVSVQSVVPVAVAAPPELATPTESCGECPDGSCSTRHHCAVGTPPVVAETPLSQGLAQRPVSAASPVTTMHLAPSFDPTPPTPPPNTRTR